MVEVEILTPEAVLDRVEKIRKIRSDDEVAHGLEDQLHQDVLEAIAEKRAEDPSACAAAALKTQDIKFSRWHG